jgi:hypothetical protein
VEAGNVTDNGVLGMKRRGEGGTAVVILVIGMTFVALLGLVAVVFAEHGRFTYSQKLTAELIASKTHERLDVEVVRAPPDMVIRVINRGSYPSVVVAVLSMRDNALTAKVLDPPVGVGVLENRLLPTRPVTDNIIGVLTSLGTAFWEE